MWWWCNTSCCWCELTDLVCLRAELEPASLGYDSSTRQKHCEGYLTAFFEWFNPTNPFQNTCALFLRFHGCYPGYSSLWSCCLTFVHRRGFGCPFSEHWYHSEATLSSSSSLPWEPSVVLCCQRFLMSTGLSSQYCSDSRLVRFPAALSLQPISIGMSTPPIAAHLAVVELLALDSNYCFESGNLKMAFMN